MTNTLLATLTAVVAFLMTLALLDQWRERRRTYQLVWAIGSLLFGIAAACEALGAAGGWNTGLFKAWYLTGAVLNVGWLGLGTAFLLAKTRFGYAYAFIAALAGIFTVLSQVKNHYADAGSVAILYLIFSLVLAIAVAGETYFQNERWPRIAAIGVLAVSVLATVMVVIAQLPEGQMALDNHGIPVLDPLPGSLRLLTPLMNITGGFALILGALFSAYVFMPKRRVLGYSLLRGRLHSRVPATLLIAIGALLISGTDLGVKGGATAIFELSKLLGVSLIFLGFLISIEAFREIRIPFTSIRLARARTEAGSGGDLRAT